MESKSKTFTMNLERIGIIVSIVISVGAATFAVLSKQNNLEFLTKADFVAFQLQNVQKMSSLESTVANGFVNVSQQIASLQFVPTKEFLDFKETVIKSNFEIDKKVEFMKKDVEGLDKQVSSLNNSVSTQNARINLLTDAVVKGEVKK